MGAAAPVGAWEIVELLDGEPRGAGDSPSASGASARSPAAYQQVRHCRGR